MSYRVATHKVRPGRPYPLGATWDGEGVNFALFSENATGVELCLFDRADQEKESHRIRIEERTNQIWHIYLPEARPSNCMGIGCMVPTIPAQGIASIRRRCSSIPMPRESRATCNGPMPCSAIASAIPRLTSRTTIATMPRTCRSRS